MSHFSRPIPSSLTPWAALPSILLIWNPLFLLLISMPSVLGSLISVLLTTSFRTLECIKHSRFLLALHSSYHHHNLPHLRNLLLTSPLFLSGSLANLNNAWTRVEANQFIFHIFHKTLQKSIGGQSDMVDHFYFSKNWLCFKGGVQSWFCLFFINPYKSCCRSQQSFLNSSAALLSACSFPHWGAYLP